MLDDKFDNFYESYYKIFAKEVSKSVIDITKNGISLIIKEIVFQSLIFIKIIRTFVINFKIMVRPIKETPVLTGKDAKRFAEKMAHLKPESKEEKEAAKKVYEKFKAIAAFTF